MDVHLAQRFDQFGFVSVGHLAPNMAPNGVARKVLAARRLQEARLADAPRGGQRSLRRQPATSASICSPVAKFSQLSPTRRQRKGRTYVPL